MLNNRQFVYVRIRRNWISVRVLQQKAPATHFEASAVIAVREAIKTNPEIVAVGDEAENLKDTFGVTVHKAFQHPRVIVNDFDSTLVVMQEFLRRAGMQRRLFDQVYIIIHPLDLLDGGITDVEKVALTQLALRLGSSRVLIYECSVDLTDDQILLEARNIKGV